MSTSESFTTICVFYVRVLGGNEMLLKYSLSKHPTFYQISSLCRGKSSTKKNRQTDCYATYFRSCLF